MRVSKRLNTTRESFEIFEACGSKECGSPACAMTISRLSVVRALSTRAAHVTVTPAASPKEVDARNVRRSILATDTTPSEPALSLRSVAPGAFDHRGGDR